MRDFVRAKREALERLPSAFFSVSLAARDDPDEARGYVERFVDETGWRPDAVGVVAGALRFTRYGFIKRRVMRKLAADRGDMDTDTTRDHVYTDWQGVDRFVDGFLSTIEREERAPPVT